MPFAPAPLPSVCEQADRLLDLGVHELSGMSGAGLRAAARAAPDAGNALLVVSPDRVPASSLAPLLTREGRSGFVVEDMTDVDQFGAVEAARPPSTQFYLLHDVVRGDDLANLSPNEALPSILGAGRTPLTLTEGLLWVLQQPQVLERNHCFMTIGSRLVKSDGTFDARTPAIWISNGTGRDGKERRHAPKVGWCWAGNRHTWLGFASAAGRSSLPAHQSQPRP